MLAALLYVIVAGLVVGALMMIGVRNQGGWLLLLVPASAVIVGIPTALLFAATLSVLPDPALGLAGPWRALPVGTLMGSLIAATVLHLSRNERRRRKPGELAAPFILFAATGALLAGAWSAAQSIAGGA